MAWIQTVQWLNRVDMIGWARGVTFILPETDELVNLYASEVCV